MNILGVIPARFASTRFPGKPLVMIDGMTSKPFSGTTLAPIPRPQTSYREQIIDWSRSTYARPKATVEENIRAILELKAYDAEEREAHLNNLLVDLHICHLREASAVSLSGGERRRVEIARSLAINPRFILLDEPFAGVDPIAVIDIQKLIHFLIERNIGVLITDHNVRETLGICDRAYIINEGRVLIAGAPDTIIQDESARKVYLGENFKL